MKHIFMNDKPRTAMKHSTSIQIILLLSILFSPAAYAYVDPGSGSVIVTTILGLIAAIGYTCRKYFYKAKRFFVKERPTQEEQHQSRNNDS